MTFLIIILVGLLEGEIFFRLDRDRKMINYGYKGRALLGALIGRIFSKFYTFNPSHYLNVLIFTAIFGLIFLLLGSLPKKRRKKC